VQPSELLPKFDVQSNKVLSKSDVQPNEMKSKVDVHQGELISKDDVQPTTTPDQYYPMFQTNPCMASKTPNQQEEKFRDSTFHGFSGV